MPLPDMVEIIPALVEIQNRHGWLPEVELEFLALRTKVPLYRLQELTTFFPHFRRQPPPKVTVHVCQSMTCHLRGADKLLADAEQHASKEVEVCGVSCLGRCDRAPVAVIGTQGEHGYHEHLFTEIGKRHKLPVLMTEAKNGHHLDGDHDRRLDTKPNWQIDVYQSNEKLKPYEAVRRFLNRDLDGRAVIGQIGNADLIGMGGAAARTAKKWEEVRRARGQTRYIICNADESEPGTFKDRDLMLYTPHLLIEGMLLAGITVGASHGFIYIRHEYHEQIESCNRAIEEARREVPRAMEMCPIQVFVSPGLYICGEESALIEVIEGKRAQPRNQPPDIRNNGLFDMPTLVNNVETYSWVPSLLLREPADWYKGTPLRFFSISGDVQKPGVFECNFNDTLGDLIDRAGGMTPGLDLYAIAPSGPSGGFLPATLPSGPLLTTIKAGIPGLRARSPLQADRVEAAWKRLDALKTPTLSVRDFPLDVPFYRTGEISLGAAIIIYGAPPGKKLDMLDHTLNCLRFFRKESCGKCVPCRLGCQQLVHFAEQAHEKGDPRGEIRSTVQSLSEVMEITSICGLGRAASKPFQTWLDYFGQRTP